MTLVRTRQMFERLCQVAVRVQTNCLVATQVRVGEVATTSQRHARLMHHLLL